MLAFTKNGTQVSVDFIADVEPNFGGYFCTITPYIDGDIEGDYIDYFCIHTTDCDCKDWSAVEQFAIEYVRNILEY